MNDPTAPQGTSSSGVVARAEEPPSVRVDSGIERLMKYKTRGDGGAALKLLHTFVSNVVENPAEPKYRSINAESKAFTNKLKPFLGSVTILKACGFDKNEEEGKYILPDSVDSAFLKETSDKLKSAMSEFARLNP